jgi:hypothetical protein
MVMDLSFSWYIRIALADIEANPFAQWLLQQRGGIYLGMLWRFLWFLGPITLYYRWGWPNSPHWIWGLHPWWRRALVWSWFIASVYLMTQLIQSWEAIPSGGL